jgi:hypothetical protein
MTLRPCRRTWGRRGASRQRSVAAVSRQIRPSPDVGRSGRARHLSRVRSRCTCCMGRCHDPHRPGRCHTRSMIVASLASSSLQARHPACDWPHDIDRTLSLRRMGRPVMWQMSPVDRARRPVVARQHHAPRELTRPLAVCRALLAGVPRPNVREALTTCAGHEPLRIEDICHRALSGAGRRLEMALGGRLTTRVWLVGTPSGHGCPR